MFSFITALTFKACICEHPSLVCDVTPVSRRTKCFKLLIQQASHGLDSICHVSQCCLPTEEMKALLRGYEDEKEEGRREQKEMEEGREIEKRRRGDKN